VHPWPADWDKNVPDGPEFRARPAGAERRVAEHLARIEVDDDVEPGGAFRARSETGQSALVGAAIEHCAASAKQGSGLELMTSDAFARRLVRGGFHLVGKALNLSAIFSPSPTCPRLIRSVT
jgi:hypothetical protein